jgi:hypothetical protein
MIWNLAQEIKHKYVHYSEEKKNRKEWYVLIDFQDNTNEKPF